MQQKTSMTKSIIWNTFGNIFYLICLWALQIVILRILDESANGIFTMAMTTSNIVLSIAVYGMRNFQVADIKSEYKDSTYIYSRIITAVIGLLFGIGIILINGYSFEKSLIIITYTIFRLSEALFDVLSGILQKNWRLDLVGISLTIRGTLSIISFSTTLYLTKNLFLAILIMALFAYASIFIFDIRLLQKQETLLSPFDLKAIFKLLKQCIPLAIYTIFLSMMYSIPRYFLDYYLDDTIVGIYGAISAPTLIVQTVAVQIFTPYITLFAEYYLEQDYKKFITLLKKCILYVIGIAIFSIIGALIFGDLGLKILYNKPEIIAHSYLLIPLVICTILTAFIWMINGILTVTKSFNTLLIVNLIAVIITVPLSIILIPRFSAQGANYTLMIALFIEIIALLTYLINHLKKKNKGVN